MKRFLICAVAILFLAVGGIYLYFSSSFYVDLHPDAPVQAQFRTEGRQILARKEDGTFEAMSLKGVDMISSMPGEYASDFAPEEADYLRWMEQIGQMGANLLRVYTLMDSDFYNALYAYNTTHEEPLFLLQGLQVSDEVNNGRKDGFSQEFQGRLIHDGMTAVDMIHGRKLLEATQISGGGSYLRDVSPWVLGYLVGNEWSADTIVYTDMSTVNPRAYQGTYFRTAEDASAFETMLAQVMDSIMAYESEKYKTQRLIGFNSAPQIDFLEYEAQYARQLSKYAFLDAQHILPTEAVQSGYFAGYRLSSMCDNFSDYLSQAQRSELAHHLSRMDTSRSYDGYLDLLSSYHTMPLIATVCGISSGRGAIKMEEPPLTEQQQGQQLMDIWLDCSSAGWAGLCISTWQDAWERIAWNTAFATELSQNYLWHDLQTDGENYGLMAFEPGEKATVVLDGDPGEWQEKDVLFTQDGITLSLRYDQKALYLLIQGSEVTQTKPLYLPLDIVDQLGAYYCKTPKVTFDRRADFLLCLNGKNNTRLLVQERYDALRENFSQEMAKGDPFLSWPDADSPVFTTIGMALRNDTLVDNPELLSAWELAKLKALGVYETGKLRHGNGNPEAQDYDSLTDFCFGQGCVELRIPWLLINVANPMKMRVHQDYYLHYGVETMAVKTIWIGLGDGDGEISLNPVDTRKWKWDSSWRERLKASYQVVQSYWKK